MNSRLASESWLEALCSCVNCSCMYSYILVHESNDTDYNVIKPSDLSRSVEDSFVWCWCDV